MNDASSAVISAAALTIDEDGGDNTDTYTVSLASAPATSVTIGVESLDKTVATVSPASLTFTSSNYSTAQTVTVTTVNDDVDNTPERTTTIRHTGPAGYTGGTRLPDVTITATDDEARGVTVTPTSLPVDERTSSDEDGEDDESASYTVGLESEPTDDVTVTVAGGDTKIAAIQRLEKSGGGYTEHLETSATLSFTPENWSTPRRVTIVAPNDGLATGERSVSLTHTAAGADYQGASVDGVTVTVADNEETTGITLKLGPTKVAEGDAATDITVTATLTGAPRDKATKVTLAFAGSATITDDYSARAPTLTIAAGAASGTATFEITVVDDDLYEGEETVSVTGTTTVNLPVTAAALAIEDNDTVPNPAIVLTVDTDSTTDGNQDSVSENVATAPTVTVTAAVQGSKTFGAAQTVNVEVGASGDTATEGTDYAAIGTQPITIAAGAASGDVSFTLDPTDDLLAEGSETVSVTGAVADLPDAKVKEAEVTITDDDAISTSIALSVDDNSVNEGETETITLTAKLNSAVRSQDTEVTWTLGGTATSGTDYTAVTPTAITIAAGEASGSVTFELATTEDTLDEGDSETVSVTGSTTVSGISVTGVDVAIADDDAATIALSLSQTEVAENVAAAPEITVTATIEGATRFSRDQIMAVSVGASGDQAVSGTDYTAVSPFRITIAAGDERGSATFTFTPINDDVDENNETLTIAGTAPRSGGATVSPATLTIQEDDEAAIVLDPTTVTVDEAAGTATYEVKLGSEPTADVTVTVTSGDTNAAKVSLGEDTPGETVTLTFTAENWKTAQEVKVTGVDDAIDSDRTTKITHSANDAGGYDDVEKDLEVTLTDNDEAGIALKPTTVTVDEAAGTATYTVALASKPTAAVTVTVTSGDTDAAKVSVDEGTPGETVTLTFEPDGTNSKKWDSPQTVTVTGVDDDIDNATERTATLSHSADYSETESYSAAADLEVTLTDDDEAGIALKPTTVTVDEAAGTATYTVALASEPTAAVTVTVRSGDTNAAKVSVGEGTPGETVTLTFEPDDTNDKKWDAAQEVKVTGVDDAIDSDRTTKITHSANDAGGYKGVTKDLEVTLTDDDTAGIVLTPALLTVDENGGTATYTVVLDSEPTAAVTVTVRSGDTAAAKVSVGEGTPGETVTLTFEPSDTNSKKWDSPRTVTVTGVDDDIDNATERTATISHSADYSETESYSAAKDLEVTLTDDDEAGITLSKTTLAVDEDAGTATYTVALASEPTAAVTVTVTSGDTDAAKVSVDEGTPGETVTLTFEPDGTNSKKWDSPQTVTVTGVDDDIDNATERTATLSHSADYSETESYSAAKDLEVTLTDDDEAGITLDPTAITVAENAGTATYTVALASKPTAAVTVTVASDSTGNATVSPASLTFEPDDTNSKKWDSPQTVTVTGVNDDIVSERTATISHSAGDTGSYDGVSKNLTVTLTDDETKGVTLSKSSATVAETGEGNTATYTVVLDSEPTAAVTVAVASNPTGTATVSPASLTFEPDDANSKRWDSPQTVTVTGVDDDYDNADDKREATISHTVSGGDYDDVRAASVTVTVTDDETKGVALSESSVTVAESGEGNTATYEVKLASQPTADVTVTVASEDATAAKVSVGEGTPGASLTLTFTTENWDDMQEVTVTAVDDAYDNTEDKRETKITHTAGATGGYDDVSKDLPVTLTDDDGAAAINLSLDPASVKEDAESAQTITVKAEIAGSTRFSTDQTIAVTVGDSGTATSGTDYGEVTDFNITLPNDAASVTKTFAITPTDDDLDEGAHETVGVAGTLTGITVNGAELQITDDETKGVTLSETSVTVAETGTDNTATYEVKLASQPTAAVTVTVASADATAAKVHKSGGTTPVASVDLTFTTGNWDTAQEVTVTAVDDAYDNTGDKRETKITHTAGATGGYDDVSKDLPVTVTDDETKGVTLSETSVTVAETGTDNTATYEVKLASQPTAAVTVTVASEDDTAAKVHKSGGTTPVASVDLTFTTENWDDAQEVTVTAVDDAYDNAGDKRETKITHTAGATGGYDGVSKDLEVTVTDDDGAAVINLSLDPASVDEEDAGSAQTITVTAALADSTRFPMDQTIAVTVGAEGDSATKETDYGVEVSNPFEITIPKDTASATGTFKITPSGDNLLEVDETVSVDGDMVTSRFMCQGERGSGSLCFVLVDEDGEEDAVHGGLVLEGSHGAGAPAHLPEPAFDGVGGSHLLSLFEGLVSEAGEELVEIVAQAGDGLGVGVLPGVGEASGGAACPGPVGGVHDGVEAVLDGVLVSLAHLVEDVSDLVRPAALEGDARIDGRQGGAEALAAVGADHLQALAAEAATVEAGQEALPFGGALAACQMEVDDLLLAVGADAERHQHRPFESAGAGLAGQHHAVEHERLVGRGERACMEGGAGGVQGLGNPADGSGRDAAPEQGEQDLAHLAGAEA